MNNQGAYTVNISQITISTNTNFDVELISLYVQTLEEQFPSKTGISQTIIPSTIVEGKDKPDLGQKKIAYGSYVLAHIGTTNTMKATSVPAIALYSGANGTSFFISHWSGRKIHTKIWDDLPIDDEAIEQVYKLAQEQDQPIMRDGYPVFEWFPGVDVHDPKEDDEPLDKDDNFDETDLQAHALKGPNENAMDQIIKEVNEFEEEKQEELYQPETPIAPTEEPTMAQEHGCMLEAEPTKPIIVEDVTN